MKPFVNDNRALGLLDDATVVAVIAFDKVKERHSWRTVAPNVTLLNETG